MKKEVSEYAVCDKCGKKYSTLTRHRCFKAAGQKKKKLDKPIEHEEEHGGDTESLDEHESPESNAKGPEGEAKGQKGKGKPKGGSEGDNSEGQGDGDGSDGDGEGDQSEGEGSEGSEGEQEGEQGEGEGEGEGQQPQSPDPETPPVVVVCTVLKFAALTAQCAKNGMINVTLEEDGLQVSGHNGDRFARKVIPWGEFEKRSTLDGEFYVKDIIDQVDEQLGQTAKVDVQAMIDKHKPKDAE